MAFKYWRALTGQIEPTYAYDDPANHPINLVGILLKQHNRPLRMVESTPHDIDRLCRTPLLDGVDNLDLRQLWATIGGINVWQRKLDSSRLPGIQEWWFDNDAISANPSIIYFPTDEQFHEPPNSKTTSYVADPASWCVDECPECTWRITYLDSNLLDWKFDACQNCGWTKKPAILVDGQHRIRGMANPKAPVSATGGPHEDEPIFISVLCNNDLIDANMAARVFIEVSGTAVDLDPSHKNFLKSKYRITPFDDATRRKAYDIGSKLNDTAKFWNMDNGRKPRLGRVTMLGHIRGDLIDLAGVKKSLHNKIFNWLTKPIDISGNPSTIPLKRMNTTKCVDALDAFLIALNHTWTGGPTTPGAGNPPNWYKNRSALGGLQAKGIFQILMYLFPLITVRIRSNADPLDATSYQAELEGLKHIDWNSSNMVKDFSYGDRGIDRISDVLKFLLETAAYPANTNPAFGKGAAGELGPTINTWLGDPLDPISAGSIAATDEEMALDFTSTMSVNGEDIGVGKPFLWMPHALQTASVTITNTTTGDVSTATLKGNGTPIIYNKQTPRVTPPTVGDVLEVEVEFRTPYNSNPQTVTYPAVTVA